MYEVEVKVEAAHDAVRDVLSELDADRIATVEQVDTYYDAPHRSFADTDEALRIREEKLVEGGVRHELTYKGPKVDEASKTREEHETNVDDPTATDAVLTALGFEPVATVEKRRDRYEVGDYTVTLDDVTNLGEFVEVERAVPEADVEAVRDGALDLLRTLGHDPDDQVRTSYLGLLLGVEDA